MTQHQTAPADVAAAYFDSLGCGDVLPVPLGPTTAVKPPPLETEGVAEDRDPNGGLDYPIGADHGHSAGRRRRHASISRDRGRRFDPAATSVRGNAGVTPDVRSDGRARWACVSAA
ncbi:hypothetical protein [Rhodococcus erythropolis]|uniref:hypothetical protein n=1 Tax=Rhodococcus erythropolis TaxID=1833 RepID=UPI0008B0C3CD|nr:hypothetical protein [Rhodococcus erythropolis]OFV73510.1 hypothetical protein RERY_58360 [Rhodococcus erythropolis]